MKRTKKKLVKLERAVLRAAREILATKGDGRRWSRAVLAIDAPVSALTQYEKCRGK